MRPFGLIANLSQDDEGCNSWIESRVRHHRIYRCSRLGSTDGIGDSDFSQDVGSFYGIALTLSGNIDSGCCAADARYDLRYPETS